MPYVDPKDPRQKQAQRRYYERNKEAYSVRARASQARAKRLVDEAKDKPCSDYGVRYPPYVMDFDHREPDRKVANIARLTTSGLVVAVLAEIEKCDLVCANCHRERTHGAVPERRRGLVATQVAEGSSPSSVSTP